MDSKIRVKFNGSCLKPDKITYAHKTIVNIYIVYEISENVNISSYPTLDSCFFGAVKLTKKMILMSTNILGMVLDLIEKELFQ